MKKCWLIGLVSSAPGSDSFRQFGIVALAAALALAPAIADAASESPTPGSETLPAALQPLQGRWYGTAHHRSESAEIGYEFVPHKGKLLAKEWLPILHVYGTPVGFVSEKDGRFVIPGLDMEFSFEKDALSGTLSSPELTFRLTRATREFPEEPAPPVSWSAPKPAWSYKALGPVWATPAAAKGIVVASDASGHLQALKVADGKLVWSFDAQAPLYGGPTIAEDAVYSVADSGWLFKVSFGSGKLIWKVDLGGGTVKRSLPGSPDGWDYASPTPIVADGRIYIGSADGVFHALESSSGKEVWKFKAGDKIRGSAICTADRVFFGSFDHFVYALDRKTGAQAWKFDTGSTVNTAPVLAGDQIVIGTRDKSFLYALNAANGRPVWDLFHWLSWIESAPQVVDGILYIGSSDYRRVRALDPKNGSVNWNSDVFGWTYGTPLVVNDTVYYVTAGTPTYMTKDIPSLGALDRKTGVVKWRYELPYQTGTFVSGYSNSLIYADGKIIAAGLDGMILSFSPL
jgi:outer membrane protein assembly factor BamB